MQLTNLILKQIVHFQSFQNLRKGKIKTFGKEKNLAQLINDIPKSYKLNIIPVSKKNKRTIDTITKPPGKKNGGIVGISHLIRPL